MAKKWTQERRSVNKLFQAATPATAHITVTVTAVISIMRSLLGRPGVYYTVKTVSPEKKLAEIKRFSNDA